MMTSAKIIILSTLYRPKGGREGPMIEITSYKNDPRGEEFFAEFKVFEEFDLTKRFVNRLIYYDGNGDYLPLANSRVMYNMKDKKTVYGGVFTPHPSSKDYRNPFVKKSDSAETIRRISVGMVETVSAPIGTRSAFEADADDLKDLFKAEPVPLGRRPRKDQLDTEKGKKSHSSEEKNGETGRERKKKIHEKPKEDMPETPRKQISIEEKKAENPNDGKLETLLKKCSTLAVQNSALFPQEEFSIEKDVVTAKKMIETAISSMSLEFINFKANLFF